MYEVEYLYSTAEILAANSITENVMSQVDDEDQRQLLLDESIDHSQKSTALTPD